MELAETLLLKAQTDEDGLFAAIGRLCLRPACPTRFAEGQTLRIAFPSHENFGYQSCYFGAGHPHGEPAQEIWLPAWSTGGRHGDPFDDYCVELAVLSMAVPDLFNPQAG